VPRRRRVPPVPAQCADVLLAVSRLEADVHLHAHRARDLEAALRTARQHLPVAQALERRSIVTEILAVSSPPLEAIRRAAEECSLDLAECRTEAAAAAAGRMGTLLEGLIGRFRDIVLGVHSTILRDAGLAGLRVALAELLAGLGRPAHLDGDVVRPGDPPERAGPEATVAVYHLTAAVLRAVPRSDTGEAVRVRLGRSGDLLTVEVAGRLGSPARLGAALRSDAEHAAALGGELRVEAGVDDDPAGSVARVTLPDQLRPPAEPAGWGPVSPAAAVDVGDGDLPEQVRALFEGAVQRYADRPGGAELSAAAARLDGPVRLALLGAPGADLSALVDTLLGEPVVEAGGGLLGELVVWYEAGAEPAVTVQPRRGRPWSPVPLAGSAWPAGMLDGLPARQVDHLRVQWPAPVLHELTLISVPATARHVAGAALTGPVASASVPGAPDVDAVLRVASGLGPGADAGADARVSGPGWAYPVAAVRPVRPAARTAPPGSVVLVEGRPVDLWTLVDTRVRAWSGVLRARSALAVLEAVLRRHPPPPDVLDPLAAGLERTLVGAHELTELAMLAAVRSGAAALPEPLRLGAERLLGGCGRQPRARLGLGPGASADEVRATAAAELATWRARADGAAVADRPVCRAVARSCEGMLAGGSESPGSGR